MHAPGERGDEYRHGAWEPPPGRDEAFPDGVG